jgi:hypothetical protein
MDITFIAVWCRIHTEKYALFSLRSSMSAENLDSTGILNKTEAMS